MIELLRIEQLALVDRIELEFGPGLNVVTGETGVLVPPGEVSRPDRFPGVT